MPLKGSLANYFLHFRRTLVVGEALHILDPRGCSAQVAPIWHSYSSSCLLACPRFTLWCLIASSVISENTVTGSVFRKVFICAASAFVELPGLTCVITDRDCLATSCVEVPRMCMYMRDCNELNTERIGQCARRSEQFYVDVSQAYLRKRSEIPGKRAGNSGPVGLLSGEV